MASLSIEVHTDKENATAVPVSRKGISRGLSAQPLGFRDQNKIPGPTGGIRKALQNVNQQIPMTSSQGLNFSKNVNKESCFSQPKKLTLSVRSNGIENRPVNGFVRKRDNKRSPALKKSTHGSAEIRKNLKSKSSKVKVKVDVEPIPHVHIPNDEEYDSDSIFPRSERLSSYVDKLMMWRPPCLFGTIPDSDPEISDHEEDLIVNEEIFDMPLCLNEIPELPPVSEDDLIDIPPPLDFDEDNTISNKSDRLSTPEPLCDLSIDTSLQLGPLQMIPDGSPLFQTEKDNATNFEGN